MRVLHFVIKKKEKGPETGFLFFFNDSDIFKNILILIITSLFTHYSQNVFGGFSILVCNYENTPVGVQVCFRSCIYHSSYRA